MARKVRDKRFLAKLVTSDIERKPCAFCLHEVDDEITFGKLYSIGEIQCHYFCCLLSCCLIQKGSDDEGLFGFMYPDILAEIERSKKHKCSYCNRPGATLGCAVSSCRKQFHLPCGRSRNAVSLYYGNYKSFCQHHAPKQRIPEHIMTQVKLRKKNDRHILHNTIATLKTEEGGDVVSEDMVCVICYEAVDAFPTVNTFWPPCCAKDAWFHRSCLQRMALSAGMHYLKCPLCNDKEQFYDAVVDQGYYVPDRDAAWELEQNAFAEIYERPVTCGSEVCTCPMGREHDSENGEWDIKLCLLCGSAGSHAQCLLDSKKAIERKENPINPSTDPINSSNNPINTHQNVPNTCNLVNISHNSIISSNDPIKPDNDPIISNNDSNNPSNQINTTNEPINPPIQSMDQSNDPIGPSNKPVNATNDPNIPSNQINTSNEPISPPNQSNGPINANKDPINTTNDQVNPTNNPINPVNPVYTINEPISSPNQPIEQSNGPINPTNDQVNSSNDPINPTNDPVNTTNDQMNATNDTINPTNDTINPANDPNNLANPINATNDQINPTNDPINTTSDPINTTNDPINPTNNPINTTNDPINTTNDAVNPTNDPINPSNNPVNSISQSQRWDNISTRYFVCKSCLPAAPEDLDALASNIEAIIQREQAVSASNARRPIMPSRMSLRRTKGRIALPSSSTNNRSSRLENNLEASTNLQASRLELNLKSPKKMTEETDVVLRKDNKLLSPFKLLERSFKEKVVCTGVRNAVLDESIIEMLRKKFRKPRPLREKQKIVNDILDGLFDDLMKVSKETEQIREWCTPKKEEQQSDFNEDRKENINLISPTRSIKLTYKLDDLKSCENTEKEVKQENITINEEKLDLDENSTVNDNKSLEKNRKHDSKRTSKKTIKRNKKKSKKSKKSRPKSYLKRDPGFSDDTLKKLNDSTEKIDSLQNSSLEISEKDHKININMVKLDQNDEAYKKLNLTLADNSFLTNKNTEKNIFDLESFKKEYLNEVDRHKFKKEDSHSILNKEKEETKESRKRKLTDLPDNTVKKRKKEDSKHNKKEKKSNKEHIKRKKVDYFPDYETEVIKKVDRSEKEHNKNECTGNKNIKKLKRAEKKCKKRKLKKKNIKLTIDSENYTGKDKIKTKFPFNSAIKLKIKLKKKQFSLNIEANQAEKKKKITKKKQKLTKLKQYILQFPEGSSNDVLVKPEKDVDRLKRKYVKQEKSPDKFKQMSIQNFFMIKSPNEKK